MKRAFAILILFITFILIYFLQLNFFSWFTIAGVKPNLFVLVLFIGLYAGTRMGTIFGIIFGYFIDVIGSTVVGGSVIALGAIGFLGGYLEKNFSKDSKITVMIMASISTIAYEIFLYTYRAIILSSNVEIFEFTRMLIIEVIFNTMLTIIIYPIMQKLGYKLEEIFKNQQILTRYF